MRTTLVAAFVAAVLTAGCGGSEPDQRLVDAVGRGSELIAQTRTIAARPARSLFNDPDVTRARTALLSGRLDDVSPADLQLIRRANQDAREQDALMRREYVRNSRDLAGAKVDPADHAAGLRRFILAWNAYVDTAAGASAQLDGELDGLRRMHDGIDEVVGAAAESARLGHRRRFDRVRVRVLREVQAAAAALDRRFAELADNPSDDDLIVAIRESGDARAILDAVNAAHPDGWLTTFARDLE